MFYKLQIKLDGQWTKQGNKYKTTSCIRDIRAIHMYTCQCSVICFMLFQSTYILIFSEFYCFCFLSATENIALNKHAWARYPWPNKLLGWGAQSAVDGRKSNLSAYGGECTISDNYKATAEWRVDLGEVLSIHRIFIQPRTEYNPWGRLFTGLLKY